MRAAALLLAGLLLAGCTAPSVPPADRTPMPNDTAQGDAPVDAAPSGAQYGCRDDRIAVDARDVVAPVDAAFAEAHAEAWRSVKVDAALEVEGANRTSWALTWPEVQTTNGTTRLLYGFQHHLELPPPGVHAFRFAPRILSADPDLAALVLASPVQGNVTYARNAGLNVTVDGVDLGRALPLDGGVARLGILSMCIDP